MKNIPDYTDFKESVNEARFSKDDRVRTKGGIDFGDETFTVISQTGRNVTVEDDEDERQVFIASKLELAEAVTEGSDYDKYAIKMYDKKWDDLDRDKQSEVVDAVEGNYPLSKIKRVKESVNEAMAYKKAQQFTKKLKDDKLLQDLIYVANKIHDKMGTNDDVQEWLKTVITYGNAHPQQWSESLDEAAPKMTHHADVDVVAELITGLGSLGRRHTGSGVTKDVTKAIKALQSLRDNIKREA